LSGPPLTVYARGEMAAPIFISHPSKDGNLAALVCGALETRGLSCWISSRDIAPGDNYQVAIVRAIRAAKAMVLIFSANANNSDEIKKELALADQSRLVVIPVRIEDVAPDEAFLYEFATRQWIDMFEDREGSIERLAHQLTVIADIQPAAETRSHETPPHRSERPSNDRTGSHASTPPASPLAPEISATEALSKGTAAYDRNDYSEALRWYSKAADQGNIAAQYNIGWLYRNGRGVVQDYAEAMRWYRKAADQGHAAALSNVGFLYQNGLGVAQDDAEAMRWYCNAAVQGDAGAHYNIGLMYANGWGVTRDLGQARAWVQKAADGGYEDAKKWLAAN
jgi:tetratricopeptide (TPR) repeat protein